MLLACSLPPPMYGLHCLRFSFILISKAMGCAGPVSGTSTPARARTTRSRSLDRQNTRGARARGPARKEGRRKQVRGVSTAARRHVRQPEALIDQLMESPSDGHKVDGLVPSYFHEFIPCHEITLVLSCLLTLYTSSTHTGCSTFCTPYRSSSAASSIARSTHSVT